MTHGEPSGNKGGLSMSNAASVHAELEYRFGAKTIKQFSKDWNISRPTIYRLAASGRLKLTKIGGATRILADDEAAFASSLSQAGRRLTAVPKST
jgi:excisionase family DNA binding protein